MPSILDALRGKFSPEVQQRVDESTAKVSRWYPDLMSRVKIVPRNPIHKLIFPGRKAEFNPITSSIAIDPDLVDKSNPYDLDETLAHELQHRTQTDNEGILRHLYSTWKERNIEHELRPSEQLPLFVERNLWKRRPVDIELPPEPVLKKYPRR